MREVFAHDTLDAATIEGPCDVVLADVPAPLRLRAKPSAPSTRARPGTPVIAIQRISCAQQVRDRRARAGAWRGCCARETHSPARHSSTPISRTHPERTMVTAKGEHEPKFRVRARIAPAAWTAAFLRLCCPYIVLPCRSRLRSVVYVLHVQSTARARTEFENEAATRAQ